MGVASGCVCSEIGICQGQPSIALHFRMDAFLLVLTLFQLSHVDLANKEATFAASASIPNGLVFLEALLALTVFSKGAHLPHIAVIVGVKVFCGSVQAFFESVAERMIGVLCFFLADHAL